MNGLLQFYRQQLIERPLRTYAIQSACMFTLGDIFAQQAIEKRGQEHDYLRTLRMTMYASCLGGPLVGAWFSLLNRKIQIQHKVQGALVRLAIDQVFFAPSIIAVFLTGMGVLEGRSAEEIKQKFSTSYFNALSNSYRFWPFVNLFGFLFVNPLYRPLLISTCALGWNAYLSYLNQRSVQLPQLTTLTTRSLKGVA